MFIITVAYRVARYENTDWNNTHEKQLVESDIKFKTRFFQTKTECIEFYFFWARVKPTGWWRKIIRFVISEYVPIDDFL